MNRRFWLHAVFLLVLILPAVHNTLSKSDRKKKPQKKSNNWDEIKKENDNLEKEFQVDNNGEQLSVASILRDHDKLCTEKKKFSHPVLAYVTPWNNGGYNIAKFAAQKFTHIAPVWFHFKPEMKQRKTCILFGMHDLDTKWLADVRANNSKIKFVPRFIIDSTVTKNAQQFLYDERWQTNCAQIVINFLKKNKMHGAVVEVWLQMLSLIHKDTKEELVELIVHWAELFHKFDLEIIVPFPAPLHDMKKPTGLVTKNELAKVMESVDFVNVMTYDYHTNHFAGIAPFEWVHKNLEYILSDPLINPSKIFLGLNFYGYALEGTTLKTVVGREFLEYMTAKSGTLMWNSKTKEHFLRFQSSGNDGFCTYPTVASVEVRLRLADYLNVGVGIWELGQGLNYFTCLL
ncbi:unnamed protein product [Thelazia callipaeda]|uniref:Chitinase domain-containing protein 1 n=1 Tax=Thelazia callipaeda TaxID=103827 RepID=A0A0N5D5T3_THECL|nr:unnamed protein product [Thelazia callipaeda]